MSDLATDRMTDDLRLTSQLSQGGSMLERATWAGRSYADFGPDAVSRMVRAAAQAAADHAEELAQQAVQETGFGVVEHKIQKNLACSTGLLDEYAGHDFVRPRLDESLKMVEVPRPAGVLLALTPSTNPVATVFFKTILGLMTRNAVVIAPHPRAAQVCHRAAFLVAEAAVAAGAPDGIIQCVSSPSVTLVEALMSDPRTSLIVATGGTGMVRAAYESGNPALGVGPGNVPVMVDSSADVVQAARRIIESKAFDNSVLCTNESVLIVEDPVADCLLGEMKRRGAHLLSAEETERLSATMFPQGELNPNVVGRDAADIAAMAGIRCGPRTKVLLAPIETALPEIPMAHEKLSPVLGVLRVPSAAAGIRAARAVVRIAGAGHSAAIHSTHQPTIMEYSHQVPVLRVSVNVGNSTGSAGLSTHLSPSMTIGTGALGNSGLDENLHPKHLVSWTRIAYNSESTESLRGFDELEPWSTQPQCVPAYPWASNDPRHLRDQPHRPHQPDGSLEARIANQFDGDDALRAEIRRLVVHELSQMSRS